MSMGLSLSLGLNSARAGGGGSAPLTIGALPTTLPASPNATATDAANLKSLVAGATGTYYIAVPDGADWDIGSTNYNNGAGTTDLTWNITNTTATAIYIAPASFYAQNFTYESNPYGDGNRYTRRMVRPCTLRGFIAYAANTTVHLWGFKRTINLFPTAPNAWPGSYQTWQDIGVATSSYLDQTTGTFNGSFRWNEYFIGKDASHTPFDITEKLIDFNSPDYWNALNSKMSRVGMITANFTSGTDTLTVSAHSGAPIAVGQYLVKRGTIPDVTGTVTILAQLTGTPGGVGTYQISATATASNAYTSTTGNSGSCIFTSEVLGTQVYVGWGDTTYASYNRAVFMPSAVYVPAWTGTTVTVSDNYIHDLYDGVRITANASNRRHMIVNDNDMQRLYHDYRRFNWASNGKVRVTSLRNIILNPLPGLNDSFDSHGDSDQAFGNAAPSAETGQYGWNVGLNLVAVDINCRGIFQNQFYQMLDTNVLVGLKSFSNLVANPAKGFLAESQRQTWHKDSVYISQELTRPNSSNFPRGSISIKAKITSNTTVTGPILLQDVVNEGLVTTGPSATVIKTGTNFNDIPAWNTVGRSAITGPIFSDLNRATTTVNDYFLMMAQKGSGAGTSGTKFTTLAAMMSADVTHEVMTMFEDQAGLDASTTVTSARAYVHGIEGTSVAVAPGSGVQWAAYDPSDGTVVRAMAGGSGTILSGQDIAVQDTTAATYLTEKLSQVSLDGAPYYFRNITRSNTFFPTIDNSARTAWSRFAAPSPSGTFKGFVVALIGLKLDKFSSSAPSDNNANVCGTTSLSSAAFRLFLNTLSPLNLRGNFFGSGSGSSQLRWDIGNDLNRHTYLLACDLTQTDPDLAFKLVKDYSVVPSNSGNTTVDTLGGTKTFTASQFFGSGWGVFNTYTSATLIDGSIQGLRISLYDNVANIPDITDVDVINGFTADMLNASDASTSVDPSPSFKALWQGNLAAWNSSVAGVGDTTNALTLQAGTYT